MKFLAVATAAVLLAGCQDIEPMSEQSAQPELAIGRYQIVNDTKNDGVFWVDTTTGRTEQCQWVSQVEEWRCFTVKVEG